MRILLATIALVMLSGCAKNEVTNTELITLEKRCTDVGLPAKVDTDFGGTPVSVVCLVYSDPNYSR